MINHKDSKYRNDTISSIEFSGFLKYEAFFDSRQTVNAREGLVVLYPANRLLDFNQKDINANPSINMLSIHSRLRSGIRGPVILGAISSAVIEADFYGNENQFFSDLNGLRLFNAYVKLNWKTTELMAGQYWHPMSVPGFFPRMISFNAGAPFHPVARNPQIQVSQELGSFKLIGSLLSQRDFKGTGPAGPGSQYLRNSGVPNIHLQAQYSQDSSSLSAGIGVNYKKIVPELYTENGSGDIFKTGNALNSISWTGYLNAKVFNTSVRLQGVYAQNAYDVLLIGGYAVKGVKDSETGERAFSNLNTASVWTDIQSGGNAKIQIGLFCGHTMNLGTFEPIDGPFYSRGVDIGSATRVAPRIIYSTGPLGISLEGEYTSARFGDANGDQKGRVTNTSPVSNYRLLFSIKYSFGNFIN
ncbi:hypothetical protein [Membranihabitans maritimus]|uniref:hypothetical protein n=1 Tax=Membranihabitans maritimus TaxID=2904244 RepID=UPI001F32A628|nr:hypothetical protein [Membranihabitans maritimus]